MAFSLIWYAHLKETKTPSLQCPIGVTGIADRGDAPISKATSFLMVHLPDLVNGRWTSGTWHFFMFRPNVQTLRTMFSKIGQLQIGWAIAIPSVASYETYIRGYYHG